MAHILRDGHNVWRRDRVDRGGLLVDGQAYYRALHAALLQARHSVVITGWQFDSDVALLRGDDARGGGGGTGGEARLLPLLNRLCEERPELHVHVLAWDATLLYLLEREFLQKLVLDWKSHPRVHFHFDTVHPHWASHHEKFAVVDGGLAFVGGMDVAASRWDTRQHRAVEPLRGEGDAPHGPYHDVQAVLEGPAAWTLAKHFVERWVRAGGERFELPPPRRVRLPEGLEVLPVEGREVAFSRTVGPMESPPCPRVQEVRALYVDALRAARRHVYVETQYLTSRDVHDALVERFRERGAGRLEVVAVLPRQPEAFKEELALELAQAELLDSLREEAARGGHRLGVYCTGALDAEGGYHPTYIHAKLLMVDDRLLVAGSANLTNRSMGLDTELNLSWESVSPLPHTPLKRSLTAVRLSLLGEHAGLTRHEQLAPLANGLGLVEALDRLASRPDGRLRPHPAQTFFDRRPSLASFRPPPGGVALDTAAALAALKGQPPDAEAQEADPRGGFFRRGIRRLATAFLAEVAAQADPVPDAPLPHSALEGLSGPAAPHPAPAASSMPAASSVPAASSEHVAREERYEADGGAAEDGPWPAPEPHAQA
jgi:phosphatidylserine/phosphatidylglycerophosphate/cardiolipin synthase-like enzyme